MTDRVVLLTVFLSLRLGAVLLFRPGGFLFDLAADRLFYLQIADLALEGRYPFLHYWLEYPPLFPWLVVGLDWLARHLPPTDDRLLALHLLLGLVLTGADLVSLLALMALARRLEGPAAAGRVGWLYTALPLPTLVLLTWFDPLPLSALLVGLYGLVAGRPVLAGLATGLGVMLKVFPGLLLPVALRQGRAGLRAVLLAALTVGLLSLPFALVAPQYLWGFVLATLRRSSWETVWALLDGYYSFGVLAPLPERTTLASTAYQAHPAVVPWPLSTGLLLVLLGGLWLLRLGWTEPRGLVAGVGASVGVLLALSKGYSPQFLLYLLPFPLLLFPPRRAVLYLTALTVLNVLEYPVALNILQEPALVAFTVLGRTVLLLACALECLAQTGPVWAERLGGMAARLVPSLVVGLGLLALVGLPLTLGQAAARPRSPDEVRLAERLRILGEPGQGVITTTVAYRRLRGVLPADVFVIGDFRRTHPVERQAELQRYLSGRPRAWVVLEGNWPVPGLHEELLRYGAPAWEEWVGPYLLAAFVPPQPEGVMTPYPAAWAHGLTLRGYLLSRSALAPGQALHLRLFWQAEGPLPADYSLFVHLVESRSGRIVSQRDRPALAGGLVSSRWPAGAFQEAVDLVLPPDAPAGAYHLAVGLYRPQVAPPHDRLPLLGGPEGRDHSLLIRGLVVR